MEENHSFNEVIGNSAMPYLNGLAKSYVLATNYYAVTHPSIGNYFSLTTGRIITNNDSFSSTVYVDNIVRHLIAAGKTWKEYSEDCRQWVTSAVITGDCAAPQSLFLLHRRAQQPDAAAKTCSVSAASDGYQ